ncbi:MAG TPA: DUF2815 family protein [Sedimentisphaerales bacterium]|nr:DUF2815 family protein [Sedimentisphaerales bacterium]
MATQNNSPKIMTPEFRLSFPDLFQPKAFEGGEPKYGCVMLFHKSTDLSKLKAAANAVALARWPDPKTRPVNLRSPFRDGDTERPDTDGYQDVIFVTAKSKTRPGVVDANVVPITEDSGDIYAGCWCKATVTFYAYDKAGNRGVACSLQNVQKLRDDEGFSSRSKPEDDFAPIGGAEEAPGASKTAAPGSMFD